MYGKALIVPEINNTGYGTMATLRSNDPEEDLPYPNLYTRQVKDKKRPAKNIKTKDFGFRTSATTKPDIFANLKSAIEDGHLYVPDIRILIEAHKYREQDVRATRAEEGMTHHFDLLTATALAWEGRVQAQAAKRDASKYQSPQKKGEYKL